MSFLDRLEKAEANTKSMGTLPEGTYVATVTDVEVKESVFDLKYSVEYTVAEGEMMGRKCWFNGTLNDETSDKKLAFVKGQVCKLAGVDSTNGDFVGTLAGTKGSTVRIDVKHTQGTKDPTKTYVNPYVNELISKF